MTPIEKRKQLALMQRLRRSKSPKTVEPVGSRRTDRDAPIRLVDDWLSRGEPTSGDAGEGGE